MFLKGPADALSAIRLLHSERYDLRFRKRLSIDNLRRLIAIVGTDVPDDVHHEPHNAAVRLGGHVVAGKAFEPRVERPSGLTLGIDYVDVFLPIPMIRSQLMDR